MSGKMRRLGSIRLRKLNKLALRSGATLYVFRHGDPRAYPLDVWVEYKKARSGSFAVSRDELVVIISALNEIESPTEQVRQFSYRITS